MAWARQGNRQIERDGPLLDQHDAVGERGGFGDVMRDEDRGKAFAQLYVREQGLHFDSGKSVEGAERLVEGVNAWTANQSPRQRDALLLAAREGRRPIALAIRKPHVSRASRARERLSAEA